MREKIWGLVLILFVFGTMLILEYKLTKVDKKHEKAVYEVYRERAIYEIHAEGVKGFDVYEELAPIMVGAIQDTACYTAMAETLSAFDDTTDYSPKYNRNENGYIVDDDDIKICPECGKKMVKRTPHTYREPGMMYLVYKEKGQYVWSWWCRCGHSEEGGIGDDETQTESAENKYYREMWERKNKDNE